MQGKLCLLFLPFYEPLPRHRWHYVYGRAWGCSLCPLEHQSLSLLTHSWLYLQCTPASQLQQNDSTVTASHTVYLSNYQWHDYETYWCTLQFHLWYLHDCILALKKKRAIAVNVIHTVSCVTTLCISVIYRLLINTTLIPGTRCLCVHVALQ